MEAGWSAPQRRIWALFDEKRKFTFHQHSETGELQETFSELPLTGASNAFVAAYQEMRESSEYAHLPLESAAPGASALIDDRLRALEGTASIVGDRIIGEAAGESIPVAIVERRGITNQDIVDRIAIEEVLQSGIQELLRHLFLCGPNEIVDSRHRTIVRHDGEAVVVHV